MTSDELNCLVHAFLVDSGFKHTAFSLCKEGRLENSPSFAKHVPRGALVDLLSKSLLYGEVESHWKADHLALNCKAEFSLLEPHVCSLEPPKPKSIPLPPTYTQRPLGQSNRINGTTDGKRKASPLSGGEGPAEKRPRRDPDDMDECMLCEFVRKILCSPGGPVYRSPKLKPKVRQQGPGDNETNPDAILVLSSHETEVFVCAFNPVNEAILVTGCRGQSMGPPIPPPITSADFARPPGPPHRLEHFSSTDQGDVTALHWNAEGTLIAIGSYDTVLRVCTSTGDLYFSHTQHQGPIFAVRFSKDGKWLITASLDGTACLWDVVIYSLDCCLDVDWISNSLFCSCSADRVIHIMQIGKPEPVKTLSGHTNEINQIKCNPSGTRLASCSDDRLRAYGKSTTFPRPDQEIVLIGHKHSVTSIAWCPDYPASTNEIIATSSWDGAARLWDSVTGDCLHVFEDHKLAVYALKFNPTGRWIATGSSDGWLHIYDVKARKLTWSWFAGFEKPGVYEIDWQTGDDLDRIALALECRNVAVIDVSKIPALQKK
ncbi:WD40 repeat-like protein [Mycena leptocephala]|nr:WD40 repeat-like protein [Mycena leptocephala]